MENRRNFKVVLAVVALLSTAFFAIRLFSTDFGGVGQQSSKVKHASTAKSVSTSETTIFDLEIRPKSCTIENEIHAASRITSKAFEEIRSEYMSSINSFSVTRGQVVKKGQLIATIDTTNLRRMKEIYEDYANLYSSQMRVAEKNHLLASARRDRLRGLADKGIIAQSELEQSERQVIAASDFRERIRRGVESMQKTVGTYDEQIKKANLYSGIDGVVTELIVDPRSMSGKLNVMPGTLVAKIEKPGYYLASASLMDSQIHGIQKGMKAEVTLPDGSTIMGDVESVSTLPVLETLQNQDQFSQFGSSQGEAKNEKASNLYKANIVFFRPGPILPSGLLSRVRIVTSETSVKTCLPWNALVLKDGKPFVKSFKAGQGWSTIPISIGKTGRFDVEITSKLPQSAIILSRLW